MKVCHNNNNNDKIHDNWTGGAVVKWLVHWTSDLKVGGLTPICCHPVVSLDKTLYPHIVSLHPGV